jgi:hypothetical protein
MIYGRTTDGGIIIGLSARNLELLKEGKPIMRPAQGELPTLRIIYGETEQAIVNMLVQEGVLAPTLGTKQ